MAGKQKPAAGHNSGSMDSVDAGARDQLRDYYQRIQRLNERIAELNGDKSLVFSEVKAHGFDLAVFRTVLSRAQQDRADVRERDHMVALYEAAIFGTAAAEGEGEG